MTKRMTPRCKQIQKDGFHTCGSYAFNLWKEDIEQGDLCDVHYWQNKAKRQPLTDEEIDDIWNRYCDEMGDASINDAYDIARAIEAKLKE
jgi:hypothetical protein